MQNLLINARIDTRFPVSLIEEPFDKVSHFHRGEAEGERKQKKGRNTTVSQSGKQAPTGQISSKIASN